MRHHRRASGQAIVEFTLAATVIFFLLAAAIDLGFIFLTQQALYNASEEGAAYGSTFPKVDRSGAAVRVVVDEREVRNRVRQEGGVSGNPDDPNAINADGAVSGLRAINLLDLNSNGINDSVEDPGQTGILADHIRIRLVRRNSLDEATPLCASSVRIQDCYVVVEVKAIYRPFFALSPVIGDEVEVWGRTVKSMSRGGFMLTGKPKN